MISSSNEIEIKLAADGVEIDDFIKFCIIKRPYKYIEVTGTDYYYENAEGEVLRHRVDSAFPHRHELTAKKRKSESSIKDRQEVDARFAPDTSAQEVRELLLMIGFKEVFNITKTAYIFWIKRGKHNVSVVIYDVYKNEDAKQLDKRRLIEVEIEKGSDITVETARKNLQQWVDEIKGVFKVSEPMNESLYEIYGKRQYKLIEKEEESK